MKKNELETLIIAIKVIPKASCNAIVGWEMGALKVRVNAAPEKGSANREMIHFLSKEWDIAKGRIRLISGETSRHKRLSLTGVDFEKAPILKEYFKNQDNSYIE